MNYFFLIYPALSVISFFFIFLYPAGSVLFLFISYVTLLWYGEEAGRSGVSDAAAAGIIIASCLIDPLKLLYFIPIVIAPTLILLWSRKRLSGFYAAVLLSPLPIAFIMGGLLVFSQGFKDALVAQAVEYVKNIYDQLGNGAERLDVKGVAAYFLTDGENAAGILVNLIPGISFGIVAILIYIVDKAKPLFNGERQIIPRDFRLPDIFVWPLIAAGFLLLFKNDSVKLLSYNALIILGTLYFLQGVQLVGIFFDRIRLSRFIRMFAYIFVAIEPHVMIFLSFFGLFSVWFQPKIFTRKIETEDKKDGNL